MADRAPIPAEAREISYEAFARPVSETAASASNRLYGPSGAIRYRVALGMSGGALNSTVVEAVSGDEAAEKALARNPGWKVINVSPAGDEGRVTGGVDALDAA